MLVARSLSVDKERVTLQTLMTALFYDLSPEEEPWIPSQGERRERELRDLIRKGRKPVALFVDEAHDLHPKTLRGPEAAGRGGQGRRRAARRRARRPSQAAERSPPPDHGGDRAPHHDRETSRASPASSGPTSTGCWRSASPKASPPATSSPRRRSSCWRSVSGPRCRSSSTSPARSRRGGGSARSRSRRSSSRRCSPRSSTISSRGCAGTATTFPTSPS